MKQKQQIINYVHEKYRASDWLKTTAFSCNICAFQYNPADRTQILLPSYRILAEILIDVLAQFPGERTLEKRNKR